MTGYFRVLESRAELVEEAFDDGAI